MKVVNEIGNKYGKLTVLSRADSLNGRAMWKCLCECGTETNVRGTHLRQGNIKSCGCLVSTINGLSNHRLYNTYTHMVDRCTNTSNKDYPYYGGKGIKVLFTSLIDFIDKMYPSYVEGYTIDRIDSNKDYEYSNCRWASSIEQNSNKSNNKYITIGNSRLTVAEASRRFNIKQRTLNARYIVSGDNFKELFRPVNGRVLYDPITLEPINDTK